MRSMTIFGAIVLAVACGAFAVHGAANDAEPDAREDRARVYFTDATIWAAGAATPTSAASIQPGAMGNTGSGINPFAKGGAQPVEALSDSQERERARQIEAAILNNDFARAQALASTQALQDLVADGEQHHSAARAADHATAIADRERRGQREQ